jgi:ribosome-binding ATPase YchF (GTP1/OBG family)
MLKAGIVGLPNVGKSTLFNAVIRAHKAPAENYPFCTIEPNLGVVAVPDERLAQIAKVARVAKIIPTTVEYVDIAGLVKGAAQGEGLGNKFLSHIREVDALLHVVRCFEDPDIHHVTGAIDPVRDIEIVTAELILADLESLRKHREKIFKDVKRGDKNAQHFCLLTDKPTIFAANVKEGDLAGADANPRVARVREYAKARHGCDTVVISAQLESDLIDLTPEEAAEYLKDLGVKDSGSASLIRATYALLGLRTFFTFNDQEARAWTVRAGDTAARAAGTIHTDFEKGFIKAETVNWADLVKSGSVHHARETGRYRIEGRDYVVKDGDVMLVKFSV